MIAEPTGNDRLALWLRKLVRYVQSCEVTSVVGGRLMKGAHGTQIVIDASQTKTSSSDVKMFKIQGSGDHDDYVTCKEWTGSAETGSAVNVAKPFNLRIAQKPTGGTGSHVTDRPYTAGEIILAVEPIGGTGVSNVTFEDLNVDAREWAYELRWCEDATAYKGLVKVRTVSTV